MIQEIKATKNPLKTETKNEKKIVDQALDLMVQDKRLILLIEEVQKNPQQIEIVVAVPEIVVQGNQRNLEEILQVPQNLHLPLGKSHRRLDVLQTRSLIQNQTKVQ